MLRKVKNLIIGDISTDTAFRYWPVLDIIKHFSFCDAKILEVGSGSMGIAPYLKKPLTGLDIFFDEVVNDYLNPVIYDGGKFPFADNSFAVVVSVDSLEHLAPGKRSQYIDEMMRVASAAVIIMIPTGLDSFLHDKKLADYFRKVNNRDDKYLTEHLQNGLPKKDEVEQLIKNAAHRFNKDGEIKISCSMLNLKFREIFMRCKINNSRPLNFVYYLFLIFLPFWRFLNFGQCYRTLCFYQINKKAL